MKRVKIILADDHEIIRDGLKAVLEKYPEFEIVAEASNGVEAVNMVESLNPDILVIDINMPKMNGMEATEHLRKINHPVKVIILSMYHDSEHITRCLDLDVMGYVVKSQGGKELTSALRDVVQNKKFYSAAVTTAIIDKYTRERESSRSENMIKTVELTNREKEIIGLIALGLTNQKIADKLFISLRTVETHRANLMRKMEVKNSVELVNKARELKLLV